LVPLPASSGSSTIPSRSGADSPPPVESEKSPLQQPIFKNLIPITRF
jgi:hypothetical protein